ncbi:hypothetical protein D9611_013684 [Ephemerocybe angulata]|uniref:F-box domain-containing protein n=1 Tax=Ephemerocybe angulata TaxID=980116 RepID=A0A8H5B9C0_9AGAR|nr:hypothetical protein D9611_013684 [Tulosesus angulatus]
MASPTLSGLPAELKTMVLSFCEAPALASLSRTSRAFHEDAERLLYGTISLYYRRPQSFACLKTLYLHEKKANLVRSLAVTLAPWHDPDEASSEESEDLDEASSEESGDLDEASSEESSEDPDEASSEECDDPDEASSGESDGSNDLSSEEFEEQEGESEDSESDAEDSYSESEWGLSTLKSEDCMKMDTFVTLFLPGACQNMGNVVFFSLKSKQEYKDWTEEIDDAVFWALESLSGKPSLRTLFIESEYFPDPEDLSNWLLQYPKLEILGEWYLNYRDFIAPPPGKSSRRDMVDRQRQSNPANPIPELKSCKQNSVKPLLIGLHPARHSIDENDHSCRGKPSRQTLQIFMHDLEPTMPFNVSKECRIPMRDYSPLGKALCKDLCLEAYSARQSVSLFLKLHNLYTGALLGAIQNVMSGLLDQRPPGDDGLDVCFKIDLKEPPKEIARIAWHELKLLFISLAAQGLRPVTLEIGAHVPYGTPPQALTKNEMKYGAQRLADVLNDPLLLETWEPLKSARFLQMDLFASRRLRSQPDRWTLRS